MHWFRRKQTWRRAVLVLTPAALACFFWSVRLVLLPFALGGLLAYLLAPLVRCLENRGFSRTMSILLVYASLAAVTALLVGFGYPRLIRELIGLTEAIPVYTHKVQEVIQSFEQNYANSNLPEGVRKAIDQRIAGGEEVVLGLTHRSIDLLVGLCSQLLSFLLAPVLAFYLLRDGELLRDGLTGLLPSRLRGDVLELVGAVDEVIRKFIRGHCLVCALVAGMTAGGMWVIGMPFALLLGLVAGVFDLIPFFGPLLGAVPALGIAILQSWRLTLYAALVVFVVQQLESNIISPKILGDALGLHPLLIIFVLLAGGELWGIPGMIFALPAAAVLKVVGRYLYLRLVE